MQERIPSLLAKGWAGWVRRLSEYTFWTTKHDSSPEASSEDRQEQALAKWLLRQMDELALDRLSTDRAEALDRAVPSWSANVDLSWEGRFARYQKFVESNGGCAPRDVTGNKFEQFLHGWDLAQRAAISDGLLDASRVRLFNGVNPSRSHTAACRHKNQPRRR